MYRLELLPSIAQLIDPRKTRKTSYVLPAIGLMHTALLTKLLDIVFNVLRCNEHHPKEQFMKLWVVDCEGGLILLELLRLSSQTPSETELRYLDNSKMLPRPLQHLRFTQNDNGEMSSTNTRSGQVTMAPLGASVKKRVETILENFFEFGPENEGFGPFFSERQQGSSTSGRGRRDGYGSDYHEDGEDEDLDDDEYHDSNGYYSHHVQAGRGGGSNDVDFDLDDMEDRVSRMNLA